MDAGCALVDDEEMTVLKPYPSYRHLRRLPRLGQIPAHWEVKRLKWTIEYCQNGAWGDEPNGIDDVACVRVADFDRTKFRVNFPVPTFRALPIEERRNKSLRKGDLLLEKSGGGDLQPVGFVVLYDSDEPAICSNFVARMPIQENYDPNFLCYLHASLYSAKINTQSIKQNTGIQNIDSAAYLNEKVPLPPLPEQQAIAAYLDRQTAKIDALIAKKQRLLDLLTEQRAALISQAVTKGNARNKLQKDNSPAPWLFPLPAGWKREKLKFNSYMKGRIGYENLRSDEYTDEGPYLVSSVHFKGDKIEWDKCNHVTRERFEMSPEIILQKDDVLFMKDGALMGKLAYVDELPGEACLNSHLLLIRPQKGKYIPKFLLYVLMTDVFEAYMIEERKGTTFFGFSQESMGNYPISLPSVSEQMKICNYIDRKTKQLDDLAAKAEAVIERLQEYRAALISSAVTGKVDVSKGA